MLNKNELKYLIKDIIREELQNYLITEIAYTLKDYKEKTDNLIPQIVENWCLIRYVSLTGDKIEYKEHWKNELRSYLNNVRQMKLKNGNSILFKQNALYFLWNRRDLDSDENVISSHIYLKFKQEKLPLKGKIFAQIVEDFKNETKNIINILLSDSPVKIYQYVETI